MIKTLDWWKNERSFFFKYFYPQKLVVVSLLQLEIKKPCNIISTNEDKNFLQVGNECYQQKN